jgi:O-antigen ligase
MNRHENIIRFGLCAIAFCLCLSVSGADIGMGIAALGLAVLWYRTGRRPALDSALARPLLVFLAVGVFVSLVGQSPKDSAMILWADVQKLLLFGVFSAALAVDPEAPLSGWYVAGALTAALLGAYQVAGSHLFPSFTADPGTFKNHLTFLAPIKRGHGTVHPVTYGEMMCFASLGGLAWWAAPGRNGRAKPALFASAAFAALLLSQTRGAWLAFGAGAVVIAALSKVGRKASVFALAAVAVIGLVSKFLHLGLADRALSIFDSHNESNAIRFELWKLALRMFKDHPLTGVGVGNFRTMFPVYHPELLSGEYWGSAHNCYLHELAERGVVGLAAFLYLLGTLIRKPLQWYRADPRPVHLWAFACAVALAVMNLTETASQDAMIWMPALLFFAFSEREANKGTGTSSRIGTDKNPAVSGKNVPVPLSK